MATREVGNLRTRLAWEDNGAMNSLTRFRDDLRGLRSEMRTITSQGKDYTNSLKGLRQQSDVLTRQLRTQQERVEELRKRYEESSRVKGEDAKQTRNLATQYNNAVAALNETEDQLKQVTKAIEDQTNPWKRLADQAETAGKRMQSFGQGLSSFGREYSTKVTAPIVAGSGAVFKAAMDFESAFTGVEKTVDGTTQQLAGLRQGIRDMAKEIPASTTEIAGVAEAAGQLGIQVENIEEFTRTMIDLGESTNLSANQAATEFARFANIVGMSQDDFDKLGSTIVDLGNNLATTESEISSMALRLAGAGAQIGLSESQILAFAGALSSVGIEAEAGGSAFSRVMINMANSVSTADDNLENFAKVANMSVSEFTTAFEKDASGAIMSFITGLGKMSDEGENVFGVLDELGLSEIRVRDALLRASGASDVFTSALEIGSKAWEENTALTEEAEKRYGTTESQLVIMWNRVKDVAITLGESLAPAIMDAIDAAEPFIRKIEEGAQAFSDMDEEQQRTILKMIGLVAAVGPASMAIGSLTSGIGGLLRMGGNLSNLLGNAKGGSGMLGRIGMLGPMVTSPVGLAIAGVGALGLGIYALNQAQKDNLQETAKNIEKRREEIESLDESIARYEELQSKNKLSTDEVLRYMDIMEELKSAKNEDTIASLSKEQDSLREKSGMTNDEIEEFLSLNETIVKNSPSTAAAISEQGSAYAETADAAKELNAIERERLSNDLYNSLTQQIDQHIDNLKEQAKYQQEIAELEKERERHSTQVIKSGERLIEIDQELNTLDAEQVGLTIEQRDKILEKVDALESERRMHEQIIQENNEEIAKADKKLGKQQEKLEGVNAEIALYNDMLLQYESMLLAEQNIVDEKGNAYESIQNARNALHEQRMELLRQLNTNEINTKEYNKQIREINKQEKALDSVQKKADTLNNKLSKDINKDIGIRTNPSISKLNRDLASSITKRINVDARVNGAAAISAYAEGTDHHPGGPFIAGEEGYEIGKLGNRLELLNFGLYDRPSGYQVFPHDESKRIIQALNGLPAYADGARPIGEANRMIGSLNDSNNQVIQLLSAIAKGVSEGKIIQIDGKTITQLVNENNAIDNLASYF